MRLRAYIYSLLIPVLVVVFCGAVSAQPQCFVRFAASTEASVAAARNCAEIWNRVGPEFCAALLPAAAPQDTVTCLVLDTEGFTARFGTQVPDWGVGVALGPDLIALDQQRIPAVGRGLREVFLHEMAHALLFQAAGQAPLPAWFHEGVAMQMAGEWRFTDTVSLVLDGRVPDLSRLQTRWPSLAVPSSRAYRTSLLAVQRLTARQGPRAVGDILAATAREGDFRSGFAAATGMTLEDFYADFRRAMRLRYGWVTLFSHWPGLFVLMAVVFALGAIRKIILTRRRLATMDEEE